MFCAKCGAELTENSIYCSTCGAPRQEPLTKSLNPVQQGHFETREFSQPFPGKIKTETGYELDPTDKVLRDIINAAVQVLLERLTPEGWEPTEPIDAGRLWLMGRVIRKNSFASVTLVEVRIYFRRWVVAGEKSPASPELAIQTSQEKLATLVKNSKKRGSIGWLIFWIIICWPAAIVYAIIRRWHD